MASRTLPLETPLLPPLVLRPPLGPRLLRGAVLVLAFIFHVFTAGWSLIANGREGDIAGAARALMEEQGWRVVGTDSPAGPLSVWLAKASMNLFGVNEFAARLPTALAVVAAVWFTIRLGERFGGIWRGFVAGLLLLCTPGMFSLARTLTPAPLEMALLCGVFYFLARGCERRRGRRGWFLWAWLVLALAYFAGGWQTVALPLGAVALLLLTYREARLRFRALLSWEGGLVAALAVAGAAASGFWGVSTSLPSLPAGKMALWQGFLLFPWSLLLLPAIWAVAVRVARRRQRLEWSEGFPLAWLGAGMGVVLFFPGGSLFDTMLCWPAFALWAAYRLEITPRVRFLRVMGLVFAAALAGLLIAARLKAILAWMFPAIEDSLGGIPPMFWPAISSVAFISALAFALFAGAACVFEFHHQRRAALLALFGAMIPAGYAFADLSEKFAPYFSCADIAHTIDGTGPGGIVVDATPFAVSSLRFYLAGAGRKIVPLPAGEPALCGRLVREAGAPFLILPRGRLPEWEPLFGEGWRIVVESGGNLLLTRLPKPGGEKTPPSGREGG